MLRSEADEEARDTSNIVPSGLESKALVSTDNTGNTERYKASIVESFPPLISGSPKIAQRQQIMVHVEACRRIG